MTMVIPEDGADTTPIAMRERAKAELEAASRRFLEQVPIERARLAREDPDGERDAIAPLDPDPLPAFLRGEMIGPVGQPLADFLAADAGPVQWFGPIVEGGLAAFLGRPESFKSFGAVQLGLAGASGSSWLGLELGEPRPFVYVSAEKSRATVRDRFAHLATVLPPSAPVWIVHRAGVTFGDPGAWRRVCDLVADLGPRTFVVCDTIASLAGPGFDENSGRDMATVLAALRQLGDAGATVVAVHHPAKHGDGTGGIRLRGHTSLWGEVDGTLEFTRPDRAAEAGMVRVEPKDGDLRLLHFRWDRATFLLAADEAALPLTTATLASVLEALYDGDGLTAARIGAEFAGHGRSIVARRLAEAVDAGLIARIGRAKSTAYIPIPRAMRVDDRDSEPRGRSVDDPADEWTIPRGDGGRSVEEGTTRGIVHSGGSIGPPVDDPVAEPVGVDEPEPEDVDDAIVTAFPVVPA